MPIPRVFNEAMTALKRGKFEYAERLYLVSATYNTLRDVCQDGEFEAMLDFVARRYLDKSKHAMAERKEGSGQ